MPEGREKEKRSCLHLEEKKSFQSCPWPMCFNIKVCAKRSIYAREKTKNEKKKKREVYLMWCVLSCILVFVCVQFFCCCCRRLSSTLWFLSMVPQQSSFFFLSFFLICLSLLETVFCILWVWHDMRTEQCDLLARIAVLGCLAERVTRLWHLAKTKACFFPSVGSCTFFSVCVGSYTPQHSLFAAVMWCNKHDVESRRSHCKTTGK